MGSTQILNVKYNRCTIVEFKSVTPIVFKLIFILYKFYRTLSAAVPSLVDILIVLSEDEDPKVASKSHISLETFSKTLSTGGGSVLQMVEESLFNLVKKLPSLLNCTESE